MAVEPSTNSWWVVSVATGHIARDKGLFLEMEQKDVGKHRVCMGNNIIL